MTDITVPTLGESVTEATVAKWFKSVGDSVAIDEPVVELETDKVTLEIPASAGGTLEEILVDTGGNVAVGALLGRIGDGAAITAKPAPKAAEPAPAPAKQAAAPAPRAEAPAADAAGPAARKLLEETGLDAGQIDGSGRGGRVTKADIESHLKEAPAPSAPSAPPPVVEAPPAAPRETGPREERVPMTRLRRRIAERLKEAQNSAAMLTTFNEVDMSAVMAARERYRDSFEKRHGVRLGFMSFFVKAAIVGLKEIPAVNAEIDGADIVYKNHYDIGVAVGTEQGLVVPVLRDADAMGFADVEKTIGDLGRRARDGKLSLDELQGGTFTITNGGIYGSMLSTPILNPPQSGILGMHNIQKRAVVIGDAVQVRPMMYLALSYDHRIVDGREAVTFLVRIKQCIEDPERMLFEA